MRSIFKLFILLLSIDPECVSRYATSPIINHLF